MPSLGGRTREDAIPIDDDDEDARGHQSARRLRLPAWASLSNGGIVDLTLSDDDVPITKSTSVVQSFAPRNRGTVRQTLDLTHPNSSLKSSGFSSTAEITPQVLPHGSILPAVGDSRERISRLREEEDERNREARRRVTSSPSNYSLRNGIPERTRVSETLKAQAS